MRDEVPAWPPVAPPSRTIVGEPFRGAVDGRRQAGRARADDHSVVLGGRGLGRDAEQLGDAAQLRPDDGLAVYHADRGVVVLAGQRLRPLLRVLRDVGLEPLEPDLVSVEEASQRGAGGVPPVSRARSPERESTRRRGSGGPLVRRVDRSSGGPPASRLPAL